MLYVMKDKSEKISTEPGNRAPNDLIIKFCGCIITPGEIAKIILLFMENEDRIHPKPGMQGADMIKDYLSEIMRRREFFDPP